MITKTSIKIQDNVTLRGALADKGLDESVLSIPRVLFDRESARDDAGKAIKVPCAIDEKVHAVMKEGLEGIISQLAAFSEGNEEGSGARVRAAMEANIDGFRLDAGGGYTTTRKAELIAEGILSAADFVPPAKTGAKKVGAKAITATIEL